MRLLAIVLSVICSSAIAAQELDQVVLGCRVVGLSDANQVLKDAKAAPPTKAGVIVVSVVPDLPADKAKLKPMNIITMIDKKPVKSLDDFNSIVDGLESGKEYLVNGFYLESVKEKKVWRKGELKITPELWRDCLTRSILKEVDEITGVTRYRHKLSPQRYTDFSAFFIELVKPKDGEMFVVAALTFRAESWLFIKKFSIKIDDEVFEIQPEDYLGVEREVLRNADVAEWFVWKPTMTHIEMIKKIVESDRVLLRAEGDNYKSDRELSPDEIKAFREVFQFQKLLEVGK